MNMISYKSHRFPPEIIQHAVWLYFRFTLSFRDVEDLLTERGLNIFYESIRYWVLKFGKQYARKINNRRPRSNCHIINNLWHLDEVFITINGKRMYLWRAVDNEGEILEVLVQSRRNKKVALKLTRKLPRKQDFLPSTIVTDKLPSYGAALRELGYRGVMTMAVERTTALRIHTKSFDVESEKCKGLNQLVQPKYFSRFILQSTTTSTSNAIWSHEIHFASFAILPCRNGVMWPGQRRNEPCLNSMRSYEVKLSMPCRALFIWKMNSKPLYKLILYACLGVVEVRPITNPGDIPNEHIILGLTFDNPLSFQKPYAS